MKIEGAVFIACDRRVVGDTNGLVLGSQEKMILLAPLHACMAFAGNTTVIHAVPCAVDALQKADLLREDMLSTPRGVYEFLLLLHNELRENHYATGNEVEDQPFESTPLTAVIGTAEKLYTVYSFREVIEHQNFCAIGSGAQLALGALHVMYSTINPELSHAQDMIQRLSEACSAFDPQTGSSWDGMAVEWTLNAKPQENG
jgi:ATP-dependent protease HslVU (ClpYQ) peptidase subunit